MLKALFLSTASAQLFVDRIQTLAELPKEQLLAKKEVVDPEMWFRYGSSNIPHFQKRYKGGEDAWLAQEDFLVVADGVGGWEAHGIDSGKFSKQLVQDLKKHFDRHDGSQLK